MPVPAPVTTATLTGELMTRPSLEAGLGPLVRLLHGRYGRVGVSLHVVPRHRGRALHPVQLLVEHDLLTSELVHVPGEGGLDGIARARRLGLELVHAGVDF